MQLELSNPDINNPLSIIVFYKEAFAAYKIGPFFKPIHFKLVISNSKKM